NPPGAPLIWAFFRDLLRPSSPANRPLHASVLVLLAMYGSAVMVVGPNHGRYALLSLVPLATVLAPIVARWWDEARAGSSRARLALAATLLMQLFYLGVWTAQRHRAEERDLDLIARLPPPPTSLVLFV